MAPTSVGASPHPKLPTETHPIKMLRYEAIKTEYRRDLPHIQPTGGTFFVTYRLKDTLPRNMAEQFLLEKETRYHQIRSTDDETLKQRLYDEQKRQFAKYDEYLDRCFCGERWLAQPEIAMLTIDTLQFWANWLYELIAYTIMANHVHVVMDLSVQENGTSEVYRQLFQVLKSIKNFSARTSNEVLNRRGNFWQKESYDHLVRDGKELTGIIRYVLDNPVKIGLVSQWENWPFSYLNPKYSYF